MTHLGQRLSALIDGELDGEDRDRVLVHLAKCEPCRAEAVALRTLKRRMTALGEQTQADSGLTGRLIELAALVGGLDARADGPMAPSAWPAGAALRFGGRAGDRMGWPEARPPWIALGAAVTVFLAGLGTAAFMVGGSPQTPEPEPHVTPAVDVFVLQHDLVGGADPGGLPSPGISRQTTPGGR